MTKTVLFDEIHISLFVPVGLSLSQVRAIRRVTNSKAFDEKLGQAIRQVLDSHSTTKEIVIALSRWLLNTHNISNHYLACFKTA